jgi:hypothetical protein
LSLKIPTGSSFTYLYKLLHHILNESKYKN